MKVDSSRAGRMALTFALIACAALFAINAQVYATAMTPVFFALALASTVILHLRLRPFLSDIAMVLALALLLSAVDFGLLGFPPRAMALFSFLGLSSLAILGIRSIWAEGEDRKLLLYAFVPPLLFIATVWMTTTLLDWTEAGHPRTLDLFLYSFDCTLGIQPSFLVGQLFAKSEVLRSISLFFYIALPIPIALVYAEQLARKREKALPVMLAFLIAGPLGVVFYNLYPATGPVHVFAQDFPFHPLSIASAARLLLDPVPIAGPRNAIPSLQMAWCLLAWWYARDLSWLTKGVVFAFLFFTVLATLGTGAHYFIDLVVAFPFALLILAICSFSLRWNEKQRMVASLFGGLGTLVWLGVLRFGIRFFWTSPAVPWALIAATVFGSGFLEYRLQKAALLADVAAPTGKGVSAAVDERPET
jgi:PAP2 superfamily protein